MPARWWGKHKGSFDDWRECRRMMREWFEKPKMWLIDKYDGQNDSHAHLTKVKKNYSTTECKGLVMVYTIQKYRHYLLRGQFKMYMDHFVLKYLVNKPVLGGWICRWLLLFQEYDFEVVVKPRWLNVGPDHLSRTEIGEEPTNLEEWLPDAHLFTVCVVDGNFEDIIHFLTIGFAQEGYSVQQKNELVVRAT